MDRKELLIAEKAIQKVAMHERKSVAEVKKEMQKAMFVGLCSQDPAVQAYWKKIPCAGDVPTPEEVIIFTMGKINAKKGENAPLKKK